MKSKALDGILKDSGVVMDEEAHTYTFEPTGEFYTGCTTVSGAWRKDFLAPWYAKEAVKQFGYFDPKYDFIGASKEEKKILIAEAYDKMLKLRDQLSVMTPVEYLAFLGSAKGAAKRKGEEAKIDGTEAHAWAEAAISKKINPESKLLTVSEKSSVRNAINAFIGWAKAQENITWLAVEEVVASHVNKVAGKLDGIASMNGLPFLVDIKTSSQLSEDYLLQCGGYDLMLREMGLQVSGYIILRTPKKCPTCEKRSVDVCLHPNDVHAETLTITNKDDMQFFRDTFLKQREAHKFYVLMANKFKDERGRMKVDVVPENEKVAETNNIKTNAVSKKSIRPGAGIGKDKKAISPSR